MKITKILSAFISASVAFAAANVSAITTTSFPLVPLAITGSVIYNTNAVIDTNTVKLKSQQVSFATKDLINLLIKSSDVSNAVVDVTTSNGIPAGSFLVLYTDFGSQDLIVTNKNGFSFVLRGFDSVAHHSYNFGSIRGNGEVPMVSSFSLSNGVIKFMHRPLPATETDNLLVEFLFDDSNGNSFDIFGHAVIFWTATAPVAGSQTVNATVSLAGTGSGEVFGQFDGIADVSATGKGSGNELVSDQEFPFLLWWDGQFN